MHSPFPAFVLPVLEHPLLYADLSVIATDPRALGSPGGLLGRHLLALLPIGCLCSTLPRGRHVLFVVVAVLLLVRDAHSDSLGREDDGLARLELALTDVALVRTQLELLLQSSQPTSQRGTIDCSDQIVRWKESVSVGSKMRELRWPTD